MYLLHFLIKAYLFLCLTFVGIGCTMVLLVDIDIRRRGFRESKPNSLVKKILVMAAIVVWLCIPLRRLVMAKAIIATVQATANDEWLCSHGYAREQR